MATFPRPPLFSPWWQCPSTGHAANLRQWTSPFNPLLQKNPIPFAQYDWPTPPNRPYQQDLRNWEYGNPNFYHSIATQGITSQVDMTAAPPQYWKYNPEQRTWVWFNANITPNTFPAGKSTDFSAPPQSWKFSPDQKTWLNTATQFYPAFPSIKQSDWPIPRSGVYDQSLRTWINENDPLLYTNPIPANKFDWPTPISAAATKPDHRTWLYNNIALSALQPLPHNQYDWPTPRSGVHPIDAKTWISQDPLLYTNPIPFKQSDWPTPSTREHPWTLKTFTRGALGFFPTTTATTNETKYVLGLQASLSTPGGASIGGSFS